MAWDQSTKASPAPISYRNGIDRADERPARMLWEFARLIAWLDEQGVAFHDEVRCPESW